MAKYFFDINASGLAHSLFARSKLSQEDPEFVASHCGQFPVISVSFGECRASTWEEMETDLVAIISRVYNDHLYLLKAEHFLEDHERRKFQAILDEDPSAHYKFALFNLTALLHRYHKKRVIVLIDEYDKPVNEAYEKGYFQEAIDFLTSAFTGCLKDNPYCPHSSPIPLASYILIHTHPPIIHIFSPHLPETSRRASSLVSFVFPKLDISLVSTTSQSTPFSILDMRTSTA